MICVGGKVKKMDLSSSTNEKENEPTPCICARKRIPPQDSGWLTTRKRKLRKYALQFTCVTMYFIIGPIITTIIIDRNKTLNLITRFLLLQNLERWA